MSDARNPYGDRSRRSQCPRIAARDSGGDRDDRSIARRRGCSKRTAPGKWTVAEILVHLAQTEIIVQGRFRYALATDSYVVQPFDQDRFMAVEPAADGDARARGVCQPSQVRATLDRSA